MTPEQLHDLLQQGKYRELLPLAEHERKAHAQQPIYTVITAACLNGLGKHSKARNLTRSAARKFPSHAQLHFELGQSHLALREFDEAEAAYLRAVELIGTSDDALKSAYMTCLGGAQWTLLKRESAIQTWRDACTLDLRNQVAREMLDIHLNEYGEPKAPSRLFDDLYHFYEIHKARYFQSHGRQDQTFESKKEFEHVYTAMGKAWNEQMTPHKHRIDAMSSAEKTELFSSIQIDFTEEIAASDMARPFTQEDLARLHPPEERYPSYKEREGPTNMLFSIPLLAMVGFPKERIKDVFEGDAPTPTEKETLGWAATIVDAVFDAIEFSGTVEEVEAMMEAVATACERLTPEEAPSIVRGVRLLIETALDEMEAEEKKKRKQRKRKKGK